MLGLTAGFAVLGTVIGGLLFLAAFGAAGAPQQAAAAALGCLVVIIPYVWFSVVAKVSIVGQLEKLNERNGARDGKPGRERTEPGAPEIADGSL